MCPIALLTTLGGALGFGAGGATGAAAVGAATGAGIGSIGAGVGATGVVSSLLSGAGAAGAGSGVLAGATGATMAAASPGFLASMMGGLGTALGATGAAAVPAGYAAAGTAVTTLSSITKMGIGVAQARKQQAANARAAAGIQDSAAKQAMASGELLGQRTDAAARSNDRNARAVAAAHSTSNILLAGRNVASGNTAKRISSDFSRRRLEFEDATKRGLRAYENQNIANVAGISANSIAKINAMPSVNPAAVGLGGALDVGKGVYRGVRRVLPYLED